MTTQTTDLIVVGYVEDEEHMLGAFRVKNEETDEEFDIEPSNFPYVLYFDHEIFRWVLDLSENLQWDQVNNKWKDTIR